MKRVAPTELRSCSNLECGATGLRSQTCPNCGAPTFSDPSAREDPETARRRRESLEGLSPELLAQLREIKEEGKEKDQVSSRYATIVTALVGVAVLLLIGGFILGRSRGEGGLTPQAVKTAAEDLLDDLRSGDAGGVCERMTGPARQQLAASRGGNDCEGELEALLVEGSRIPPSSAIVDTSVADESALATVESSVGPVQIAFVREDGKWRVASADPVLTIAAAAPAAPAVPVAPPTQQPTTPGQTTPGQTTTDQTTPGQTTTDQTTTDQATPGTTTPGEETAPPILEGGQQP